MMIHGLVLIFPIIIGLISGIFFVSIVISLVILISHLVIDFLKLYAQDKRLLNKASLFIIDQILHLIIIILLSELIFNISTINLNSLIFTREIINWTLLAILVTKPANILFKIAFEKFELERNSEIIEETEPGAGAIIGNLERLLSLIFIQLNQLSAIGLIYTAKSIARFKQIEENKRFAEYYLIGTLFSILYAIVAYILVLVL